MTYPLISICIVTYNHQEYIEDCLYSVLAQKGDFKLQILIGDDASGDATVDIAKIIAAQHSETVQIYDHEKNLGASQNYQFLINKAQGDFIAHLDGDDFWLPGKLKAQLSFLDKHSSCIACYTNAVVVNNEKEPWGFFNYCQKEIITQKYLITKGNFLNHSSLLYRSEGKEIVQGFPDEFIDFRIHLNLAQKKQLGYINKALVTYRVNSNTSMLKVMPTKVVLLYYDALISIKGKTSGRVFKSAMNNYTGSLIIDLIARREFSFLHTFIIKINRENSISWIHIIMKITLNLIPLELINLFKINVFKSDLRILKKNS